MDRRRRAARTVALMSLFSMTDTLENVPVASFDGDGSDLISLIVGIEPIQAGSGDPSPDNVRPISGWTGAKVTRTGVNVWDEEWEAGGLNISNGDNMQSPRVRSKNYIPCIPSVSYFWSLPAGSGLAVCYYDTNKNFVSGAWVFENKAKETPSNAHYMKFSTGNVYGTTYNNDISINYPATYTEYHAYQGTTYSITFPSSAGTVYGGTLDVTTGKLMVTDGHIASYNGETLPSTWISDRDVYAVGANPTTGAEVVYKLATPIVYDLTPTQVTTLIGTNNIWADTGDIKYIEYNI